MRAAVRVARAKKAFARHLAARRHSRCAAATLLLGLLLGCTSGPTPRPPASPPQPTPVATPAPTPLPTPTPVPLELACASEADCTTTPYPRAIASTADCYCPSCPQLLNAAVAHQNEVAWQRLCGGGWAAHARCMAPMCARPPAAACRSGACGSAPPGG